MSGQKKPNPLIATVIKTPEAEQEQGIVIQEQIESLAEQQMKLERLRQQVQLEARQSDLEYIKQIDTFIAGVLEALSDPATIEEMKMKIRELIREGDMKGLKELMIALAIPIDKREMLLGFDETRSANQKRKMKLQVVFKNADGSQAGLSLEQS